MVTVTIAALFGCSSSRGASHADGGITGSPGSSSGGTASPPDGGASDGGEAGEGGPVFVIGDGGTGSPVNVCAGGEVGGTRPVQVRTFASYDCKTPAPLVILLHDYGSSGALAEAYFGLAAQADTLGFLYAHPDGTKDSAGNEFWNATDACCNIDGSAVDDSTYLSNLLYEIRTQYNVDPKRVYLFGAGNGGFLAYRAACDHALQITAVADLGGATWADSSKCALKAPMSALEIHGTGDATFLYDGGTNLGNAYPSASATVAEWVKVGRCSVTTSTPGTNLDLDSTIAGAETTVMQWPGCPGGTSMELWSIQGGAHAPTLSATFTSSVLGFLLAHRKP